MWFFYGLTCHILVPLKAACNCSRRDHHRIAAISATKERLVVWSRSLISLASRLFLSISKASPLTPFFQSARRKIARREKGSNNCLSRDSRAVGRLSFAARFRFCRKLFLCLVSCFSVCLKETLNKLTMCLII